jgi:hypothetical protein
MMLNTHFEEKAAKLTQSINDERNAPNLEKEYQQVLVTLLQRRGVAVVVVQGVRDKYGKLDIDRVKIPPVDALIDLSFQSGYASATPTSSYRPLVIMDVTVYSPDKHSLFHKHLTRGAKIKEAPGEPHYADFDALVADAGGAFDQLRKHALGTAVATLDLLRLPQDAEGDAAYVDTQIASAPGANVATQTAASAPTAAGAQVSSAVAESQSLAAEPSYPHTLAAEEIAVHFRRNPYIEANKDRSQPFTMSFRSDSSVERNCPSCRAPIVLGSMSVRQDEACFEWNGPIAYTPSGCYKLVQRSKTEFLLRGTSHNGTVRYAVGAPPRRAR